MALRYLVSTLALATSLATIAPASAQTAPASDAMQPTLGDDTAAPDDAAQSDNVIVTGTRISRPNLKSASPILTIGAAEIKAQGAVNLEEVTNRLGQVQPDAQQNYQQSNGQQRGAKLRGLDFNRTLSLLNGQRIAGAESVDINLIPTSLVERIDLLTGGASSVYGSDAIAGVVNYVIKKDFTGLQLSANYSFYNHTNRDNASTPVAARYGITTPTGNTSDGGRADLMATVGHNFLEDRLNISAFAQYRHADGVLFRERDSSGCQLRRDTGNPLRVNNLICGVTAASPNGTLTANGVNYSNVTGSPGTFALASTIPGYANQGDRLMARGYERYNAGGFLNFKASPAAEISASVLYLRDKSANLLYGPYVSGAYQVNCNNPLMSASQTQTICGAAAGTAAYAPLTVQYGFPGLAGDRDKETFTNTQTRATLAIRGEIAEGWHYDVGGVYDQSRQLWEPGGNPVTAKVNRALDVVNVNGVATCRSVVNGTDPSCVPLNVFVANNKGSTALSNYLFNEELGVQDLRAKFYDVTANLTADFTRYGITSPFAEQGLAVAIGAEYRKQQEQTYRNQRFNDVYYGGALTGTTFFQQDVVEGNIEAQLPLVQNVPFVKLLQANGGYRLSKYSTNTQTFATWKMEAVWSPSDDITFRFGKNRAARAPGLREADQPVVFQNASPIIDPCASVDGNAPRASREACRLTGLPDALYAATGNTLLCLDNVCRQRNNGVQVDPEDARTTTYGLVLTPRFLPRFSFSVDRYKIQVNNVISFTAANTVVESCVATGDPYYCSRLVRDATTYKLTGTTTTSGYIQGGVQNVYRLFSSGYDFQAQYSLPLGRTAGKLDFLMNGTLTTDAGAQDAVYLARRNCVGYFGGSACGQPNPRWVHNFRTTYSTDDGVFNTSIAWRYIDSVKAAQNGGPGSTATSAVSDFTRIPVYNYFDLALGVNIAQRFRLNASVNNIFDKQQPIMTNTYDYALSRGNTIPQRYDTFGRTITIGVTTNF